MNKKNIQNSLQYKKIPLKTSNIIRPLQPSFIKKQPQNIIQINLLKLNQVTHSKPTSKQNTDRTFKDPLQSCRSHKSIEDKENLNIKKIILLKEMNQKPRKSYVEIQRQKNNFKNLKNIDKLSYCQSKSIFNSDIKIQSNNESRLNISCHPNSFINDFNNQSLLGNVQNTKKQENDSMVNQIVQKINESNLITQHTQHTLYTQNSQHTVYNLNQAQQLKVIIKQLKNQISERQTKVDIFQKYLMQSQEQLNEKNLQLQKYKNDILQLNNEKQLLLMSVSKYQMDQTLNLEKIKELQIHKNSQIALLKQQSTTKSEVFTKQLANLRSDYNIIQKQNETYRRQLALVRKQNLTLRRETNKYKNLAEQVLQKVNETDRDIQNSNYSLIKQYEIQIQQYKNQLKQKQFEKVKQLTILLQKTQNQLNTTKKQKVNLQNKLQLMDKKHNNQLDLVKQNYTNEIKILKQKNYKLIKQNNQFKYLQRIELQQQSNQQ